MIDINKITDLYLAHFLYEKTSVIVNKTTTERDFCVKIQAHIKKLTELHEAKWALEKDQNARHDRNEYFSAVEQTDNGTCYEYNPFLPGGKRPPGKYASLSSDGHTFTEALKEII